MLCGNRTQTHDFLQSPNPLLYVGGRLLTRTCEFCGPNLSKTKQAELLTTSLWSNPSLHPILDRWDEQGISDPAIICRYLLNTQVPTRTNDPEVDQAPVERNNAMHSSSGTSGFVFLEQPKYVWGLGPHDATRAVLSTLDRRRQDISNSVLLDSTVAIHLFNNIDDFDTYTPFHHPKYISSCSINSK